MTMKPTSHFVTGEGATLANYEICQRNLNLHDIWQTQSSCSKSFTIFARKQAYFGLGFPRLVCSHPFCKWVARNPTKMNVSDARTYALFRRHLHSSDGSFSLRKQLLGGFQAKIIKVYRFCTTLNRFHAVYGVSKRSLLFFHRFVNENVLSETVM